MVIVFSCNQADDNKSSTDDVYLKHAPLEWDSLFNAGNAEAVAALYTDDVLSMPFDAPTITGIKAQEESLKSLLEQNPGAQHHTLVDEIITRDSISIERSRYTMAYTPLGTGKQINETGRHVMCRKKINGQWKIAWEIWNTDKPLQ